MNKRLTISMAVPLTLIIATGPLGSLAAAPQQLTQQRFARGGLPDGRGVGTGSAASRPSGTAFSSRLLSKRPNRQGPQAALLLARP
jgi:hypothetical protein